MTDLNSTQEIRKELSGFRCELSGMRQAIDKLSKAVSEMAVLEAKIQEREANDKETKTRFFNRLELAEKNNKELEKLVNKWINAAYGAYFVAGLLGVLFLFVVNGYIQEHKENKINIQKNEKRIQGLEWLLKEQMDSLKTKETEQKEIYTSCEGEGTLPPECKDNYPTPQPPSRPDPQPAIVHGARNHGWR